MNLKPYQVIPMNNTNHELEIIPILVHLYVPSRSLRSSADIKLFQVPTFKRKQHGQRAFSHFLFLSGNRSLSAFKSNLKTFLFKHYFDSTSWISSSFIVCVLVAANCVHACVCVCSHVQTWFAQPFHHYTCVLYVVTVGIRIFWLCRCWWFG